ncbi:hypothetical protein BC829DRAFT_134016 [Chytridium lagenaria]|nr:hypothetical protein BC829DRAFT_134016 [Chytridium lagenaria]
MWGESSQRKGEGVWENVLPRQMEDSVSQRKSGRTRWVQHWLNPRPNSGLMSILSLRRWGRRGRTRCTVGSLENDERRNLWGLVPQRGAGETFKKGFRAFLFTKRGLTVRESETMGSTPVEFAAVARVWKHPRACALGVEGAKANASYETIALGQLPSQAADASSAVSSCEGARSALTKLGVLKMGRLAPTNVADKLPTSCVGSI